MSESTRSISPETARFYDYIEHHPEIDRRDIRTLSSAVDGRAPILDVGCGAGDFLRASVEELPRPLGIDVSPAATRLCVEDGLEAMVADVSALPFRDESFAAVRAKDVLEHLYDPLTLPRECLRVLIPGGILLIRVPTLYSVFYPVANFYDDYSHFRPFTKVGLRRLLEDAGLEVVSVRGHTAGRGVIRGVVAKVLTLVLPRSWVAVARKPQRP